MRGARTKLLIVAAIVGLIAVAVVEGLHWWRNVTVTSAWIDADFTVMGSGVNGRVKRIEVHKGDPVEAGELLATMDSELAELDAVATEADLAKAKAERVKVKAELAAFRQDVDDRTETLNSVLALQARERDALRRRLAIAEESVARNDKLRKRQTISRQTADDARDRLLDVLADLRRIETEMAEKRRGVAELEGARVQENIFLSRLNAIEREVEKLEAKLKRARRQLDKMHIYAPTNAVINEVFVNAGAYVEDGDRVFLLHNPKTLWIEAPVDASEIRHVATGQQVEIDVEAYPYDTFYGTVRSVGQVTAGVIATKAGDAPDRTTPRVPVFIDIDAAERTLWPGARATVHIRIR